ncbi:hypothetical protein [Hymenobacter sp. BT730]|uniref:HYC_CC_PP family protein n=1 Tax=Hymenobacter sp. BT730 TaxID=3063332 RepID=UPI0026E08975|nr:hypothetical protein [Hymenobacter sp. BT730]
MKRPLVHRLFSAWLALLVLTASVGFTVQQHICRMSGQRTAELVFTTPQHGCVSTMPKAEKPAAGKAQLKAPCCDFKAHLHKLSVPGTEQAWSKLLVPGPISVSFLEPIWPTAPSVSIARLLTGWHASDSSPPLFRAGRDLLTFVCILVV